MTIVGDDSAFVTRGAIFAPDMLCVLSGRHCRILAEGFDPEAGRVMVELAGFTNPVRVDVAAGDLIPLYEMRHLNLGCRLEGFYESSQHSDSGLHVGDLVRFTAEGCDHYSELALPVVSGLRIAAISEDKILLVVAYNSTDEASELFVLELDVADIELT